MHGEGQVTWADGRVYVGQFSDGQQTGYVNNYTAISISGKSSKHFLLKLGNLLLACGE